MPEGTLEHLTCTLPENAVRTILRTIDLRSSERLRQVTKHLSLREIVEEPELTDEWCVK
jgi:hypothetical protein